MKRTAFIQAQAIPRLCLCLVCSLASSPIRAGESAVQAVKPSPEQQLLERVADLRLHHRKRELAGRQLLARGPAAFAVLLRNTHSARSILRQVACILLGELGNVQAEEALLRTAVSADFLAGGDARKALVRIYAKLPPSELQLRLHGNPPDTGANLPAAAVDIMRLAALRATVTIYSAEGAPALPASLETEARACLNHASAPLRAAAAQVLGLSGEAASAKLLLARVQEEKEPSVLIDLCRALARVRPAEGGDQILPLTKHEDQRVQLEAAAALYGLGYGGTIPRIAAFLDDEMPQPLRRRAAEILGELRDPAALEALAEATRDSSWTVRLEAVRAFAKLKSPGVTGPLRTLLKDEHPAVRVEAALLLHAMQVPGAVWALIDDLQEGALQYRRAAALALGQMHSARAVQALSGAVHDKDLELACRVAEALGQIKDRRAGRELFAALRDTRAPLQVAARQALVQITGSDPGEDPAAWPAWAKANGIQ